jgi:phospholipid transport system substrate-binding protein
MAVFSLTRPVSASDEVIEPIQQLVDGLLDVMKAGITIPFVQRFAMLAPIIDQTFDLTVILQRSVGPVWATLAPDEQNLLTQAFRSYTVASYVNNFAEFDGQRFIVLPAVRMIGPEQVVRTEFVSKFEEGHVLDYVMQAAVSGWRVVDVLMEGSISRVAVQRSDFRRIVAQGTTQALLESLRSKSIDLSKS